MKFKRLRVSAFAIYASVLMVLNFIQPLNGEATDATKSESTGSGLQFATAGVVAQFTVTAKDESGVRRTSGGDEWIVELDGTRSITGSVVDNLDGTYQVSYTATQSGSYEANVMLAKSGGLTGSYFENVWFFYTPVKVTVDPQINMDWGTGLITPTGANYISARWVGKVKTLYAETYTFYATTDDGARLWVDNVPMIDRWDSFCNETSATIALQANVFYDIKMEYKQITGSAFAKLAWASQSTPKEIVPSSQLYYETQAKKSPFSFIVVPNVANGSRSTAAGTGLALATAGTGAQFTIQANDMYDNERGDGGDIFSVRIFPPNSINVGLDGRSMQGVVVDNTDSSYSVEYTTYQSGISTLYAALLVRGGVTATYYDLPDFTSPVKYAEGTTNLQYVQFQPMTASNFDNSIPTINDFSVRYAGFVAPTKDSVYSFLWNRNMAASADRVRIWIDNSLIVDQWVSLGTSNPSGNIDLRSAYYYDVRVDYKYQSGCLSGACTANARLQWFPNGGVQSDITSTNLYRGYNVMDSPFIVNVQPAGTCAAKSIAIPNQAGAGHSLELSTAGLQAEFTITAKDIYGNLRLTGGDNFKVRLTGVDSTAGLVQDLAPSVPGAYRVVYTATKSGTYDVSVVFGASGVNQSPFRMVCQPARRHLARSIPSGHALTLSTAGVRASVTITVKDRHDNWQPDPSVIDAGVQFSITDVATLQPSFILQDSLTPDDLPHFVDTVSYIGPSTNAGKQVATPTDLDNPRLVLRYTITRSGKYSLAVGGSKANDGPVNGSPFDLTIFPNVACSTTSTAAGASLTLATAGIPGTFTVRARDQYFNLRGSNVGDNFVARVRQYYSNGASLDQGYSNMIECGRPGANCNQWNTYNWGWTTVGGRDKPASVLDNGDGTYSFSFNATRSTTNYIWTTFAIAGGLQATYYVGSTAPNFGISGSSRYVQVDQTVDFSVTATTSAPYNGAQWTARWTGLVRPSLSEVYTFYAGGDISGTTKNERVKLWVDNSLIIHQWTSLNLPTVTSVPSGKIGLQKDQYYEILLAAFDNTASTTATAKFQLQWSSNTHAQSVISSSRLFVSNHISGSPFVLNVVPAITCAATSRVYRPALTLTTAGILSSFTLQSKDAFDNLRTIAIEDSSTFDFAILANASLPIDDADRNRVQPSQDDNGELRYVSNITYTGSGGYQVNFTATTQGRYSVRGLLMQAGGVFGTYFENDDLSDHGTDTDGLATNEKPYQRMDATIDFNWQGFRPVPPPSTHMKKDIGPNYFSARWQGMIEPSYSEVYTFHTMVDDGMKLWINGLLIIDQWYSRCSEVDGTIALMMGTLYPIKIEYKQVVGNATIQLRWSSRSQSKDIVPASSLYANTTTFNLCNRNMSLVVEPAVVCASASAIAGSGLTGATAGLPSKFIIQSRDEYMNNRKLSDSGIRPGNSAFFCDDWAHSGTLKSGSANTVTTVFLDPSTASFVNDFYVGRTLTLTGGTGAGQSRIIQNYDGFTKVATIYPPLSVVPDSSSKYSVGNYGGQFSEKCDDTRTQAYRLGFPEFHVRISPVIEGSQAPYHAAGILDSFLVNQEQGSGISRLSSIEYPGGLTATYYDVAGNDYEEGVVYSAGFSFPNFATRCTTALECDQTIDFSHAASLYPLKLTYGKTPQMHPLILCTHFVQTFSRWRKYAPKLAPSLSITPPPLTKVSGAGEYPNAIESSGPTVGALAATYYDHPSLGWELDFRLLDAAYGARWSGLISPTLSGIYTFHAQFADSVGKDDRVKLWIDNNVVIQQWNSLANTDIAGTFAFTESYPAAYPIFVHYKNPTAASVGGLTLRWENMATGTTLSAKNAFSAVTNSLCGQSDMSSLCLATVNSFVVSVLSSFGSISPVDKFYVGQTISTITPPQGVSTATKETKYVKDYFGVQTGICLKAGTLITTYLDSDASTTDNFYVGMWLQITSGTGVGQFAQITSYTGCSLSGCDPNTGNLADTATKICDCSGVNARKLTHSSFVCGPSCTSAVIQTDLTSHYSIHQYRASLTSALTVKTTDSTYTISNGFTLVTYGQASCAEFTGIALSGGNTTTTQTAIVGATTTSIIVYDANSIFGLFSQIGTLITGTNYLWIAIGAAQNIMVTVVASGSNTLTVTPSTVTATMTCVGVCTFTVVPRSTLVLAPGSNTAQNFYASAPNYYYIQIISGTCAGQWRKVTYSLFNGYFVTVAVAAPWSLTSTKSYLGCVRPDSSSVYYLSKVCTMNTVNLQPVGPISSLLVKPGVDGEAILESQQSNVGVSSSTGQWSPAYYAQMPTQGDNYPYPYQPYDYGCCAALSGNDKTSYYNNMLLIITAGTGRGQRRFTTAYDGPSQSLTVYPNWDIIPDSTSRYALYKSRMHRTVPAGTSTFDVAPYNNPAPIIPSTRIFPLRSRYEVTYTPTVKGDYQVHASLAQGSGLDATYYDDLDLSIPATTRVEPTINFDITRFQRGFGNDVPRDLSALGLSDGQSFSVRWAGLLQLYDDIWDTTFTVFTFEAAIAETDERVKLWVDNSLIIDRWETYDYLSATVFSATIGLRNPYYYDLKMEYKQFGGASAKALLRWNCGTSGSPCQTMSTIPSTNLFILREISGSPFPPHEVQPGPTCAARSSVSGIPLSLGTAGIMDSFTIQASDEYDNERGFGGDHFVVRAVPYNVWNDLEPYTTPRSSMDCVGCPRTVYGQVEDSGDSSYVASFNGTKKGSYKVLTSLALQGGMFATYYMASATGMTTSRFHRVGQVADSEKDFPSPCLYRSEYRTTNVPGYTTFGAGVAAWRGFEGASNLNQGARWLGSYQCQNWISGNAQNGYCSIDSHLLTGFSQCNAETSTTPEIPNAAISTIQTIGLDVANSGRKDGYFVGMIILIAGTSSGATNAGVWRYITSYVGTTDGTTGGIATVDLAFPSVPDASSTYIIYTCGSLKAITGLEACNYLSTTLQPLTWWSSTSTTIILDQASSIINGAYEGWEIKIVNGSCKGQVRKITGYVGKLRKATVYFPWTVSDGILDSDAYGARAAISGCIAPDNTSSYILYHQNYAPGSMESNNGIFAVRWVGFVKPSATSEYTFQSLLSGTAGLPNRERVKLWVDNLLIIDQWTSISSTSPSGTISFPSVDNQVYDIQVEYIRQVLAPLTMATAPGNGETAGDPTISASAPSWHHPPRMSLRWKNEKSGADAALSEAYDYKIISTSRLFTNFPVPNSRILDLMPGGTSPAASVATGNGLTAATAGSEASFTITAKDAFANDRELEEDSFTVIVSGPGNFRINTLPSPSPSIPGTYIVSYIATVSGSYQVTVRRASAGGLKGEYFNNMWLLGDTAVTSIDPQVAFDWGDSSVAPSTANTSQYTGSDYMSVRWSGLFKPELSEIYTFFVTADNGVRIYVDGLIAVDQWEVQVGGEYNATLAATAGLMYEFVLEYRHVTGNATVFLSYSSPSIAKRTVPSSRLFNNAQHIFGSPFNSYVSPTITCGSTSQVAGQGLSYATAARYAAFTIQARDEYLNLRTRWEDTFVVKAAQIDRLDRSKAGTVSANVVKGRYNVAYLVTKAGPMDVYSMLAVTGGIMATYYDSVAATFYNSVSGDYYSEYSLPAKARKDSNIYMNNYFATNGGGTCACDALGVSSGVAQDPISGTCSCASTSLVQDQVFAARWSGLIRPCTSALYTFKPISYSDSNNQERVKLWLDNKLVIDQWNSLAATGPTATFAFPVAMDYYELKMEYRVIKASSADLTSYTSSNSPTVQMVVTQVDVAFGGKLLGSSYLAVSSEVQGSPFSVTVMPDVTDWEISVMNGTALTISSAGVQSAFLIRSKDSSGNLRSTGNDQYLVHISSVGGAVLDGTVQDLGDGSYIVKYMATTQGTYDIRVFLGSADKSTTLLVQPGEACASTSLINGIGLTVATAGFSATFTIQAKDAFKNLRTIGSNDFLARLIGPSSETHNNPVSYIGVSPNTNLGRFQVAYRPTRSGNFSIDIKLASLNGLNCAYYRDTSFENEVKTIIDGSIDHNWGLDSPDSSLGIVDGFSIRWNGYLKSPDFGIFTFLTSFNGIDERIKLWVDDQWVIDQWSSLGAGGTAPTGTLYMVRNALYDIRVEYKDLSGPSEIHLAMQGPSFTESVIPSSRLFSAATSVAGSPFMATVFPALTSGTVSTATGSGLSVATAGVPAMFTIQAMDNLGNPKSSSDDIFVVRARHNADYSRRNILGTVTPVAGGMGLYSVAYTATWKRNSLSCASAPAGLVSCGSLITDFDHTGGDGSVGGTSVRPTTGQFPNLIGNKHKFHDVLVSQALQGGLQATYYTSVNPESAITADSPYLFGTGTAFRAKIVPTVFQSMTSAVAGSLDAIDSSFGVRFTGFFSPPTSGQSYTFTPAVGGNSVGSTAAFERVRLWLDNSLVVDQWSSLATTRPTGTLQFDSANGLYDIKLEYKQDGGVDAEPQILLLYSYAAQSEIVVPSGRLYQSYDLTFNIYDKSGLTATYYDTLPVGEQQWVSGAAVPGTSAINPLKAVQESTVDWSGPTTSDRPYPASVLDGEFSVRWTGFIRPSRTDEYTFYLPLNPSVIRSTGERLQLWVDNTVVIAQWSSLASLEPSGTAAFPASGEFYNVVLDYMVTQTDVTRGLQLVWENQGRANALYLNESEVSPADNVQKGIIRPDSLFQIRTSSIVERDDMKTWDMDYYKGLVPTLEDRQSGTPGRWERTNGCPEYVAGGPNGREARCRGQGLRTNDVLRVDVRPAAVCSAHTTISDLLGSLTLSTAGVTRTFTLTARDAYDNQRDAVDDSFIARASLLGDSSSVSVHAAFVPQSWETLKQQGEINPMWDVNGKYEATYLMTLSGQYTYTIQSADVQGNGLYGTYFSRPGLAGYASTQVDANINFEWGTGLPTADPNIGASNFSVRWMGYVKANYSEVYTFYTSCDSGVRLYVDHLPLVDNWSSSGQEYSGTITLQRSVLYDLKLEYQSGGGNSFCNLSFESPSTPKDIIPSSSLFVEAQTISGGDLQLDMLPTVVSGTVSTVSGPGLSIATAGIAASFTVMSMDMYGNLRDDCNDLMFVRMVPDAPSCPVNVYPYDWASNAAGTFYTCTSVGKIRLVTSDATSMTDELTTSTNHGNIYPALGLSSSYYGFTKLIPSDNTSAQECTPARFSGNKNPFIYVQTRAGSHTLYASEVPGGKGTSYGGVTQAVGTGLMATYYETSSFGTPRQAQDCIVPSSVYFTARCDTTNVDFSTINTLTPGSLVADGIFSLRWTGLIRAPQASSYTFQAALGSVTALDERVKLWVDNSLLIDQWSSLASTTPQSIVPSLSVDQLYDVQVEYKNVAGGATDGSRLALRWAYAGGGLSVVPSTKLYPSHPISGQALRVRLNPNVAYARECEVYGQGLTVATAGMQATFAIQAKDAYNNIRGTGGDLFVVRAFSDGCQVLSNAVENKPTCQPYGPAVGTCGNAGDPFCPSSTNPAPETNDGGDDDGQSYASVAGGVLGQSRKVGGMYRQDSTSSLCANCPRIIRADVVDHGDSTYTAYFTGTQKGRYTVVTSLVNSGGLAATYYDDTPVNSLALYSFSSGAVAYRVDMTVDWSGSTATTMPSSTLSQDGIFGVRWVGFVRPSKAQQYTFHVPLMAAATDRVKLWVDNSIIIQQWASVGSTAPSGTIGFAAGNGYYDISMVFQSTSPALNGYQLLWENTGSGVPKDDTAKGRIPSTRLFQRYDLPNSGLTCTGTPCITKDYSSPWYHTTLQIMPSVTCASQSTAYDGVANVYGLTLATAGVAATFTLQAKDAYENTREDTSATFTVDLFGSGGSPIYNGAVSPSTSSTGMYSASYTAVNAKTYDLFVKYGSYNIEGAPFTLTVKPSVTCGTKSTIQGSGLTAASISPSKSAFTIQSRDQYGNSRTQALQVTESFVARVVRTSGSGMQGTNGLPPFYGKTAISSSPTVHSVFNTATNDGKYAGFYQIPSTPSPSGLSHYLYASWLSLGSVYATYYTSSDSGATLNAPLDTVVSGTAAAKSLVQIGTSAALTTTASTGPWGSNLVADTAFIIRWNGLYSPNSATQMYFQWSGTSVVTDRVKLWVDNKLVIDQWSSLAMTAPTAGYLFDSTSGIYDIHVEYFRPVTGSPSAIPVLREGTSSSIFAAIPTTRIYAPENLSGSPYAVVVSS